MSLPHPFTRISIHLSFSLIFLLPVQLPILYPAFLPSTLYPPTYLSHTLSSLTPINILLPHFYTHLSSIHLPITHIFSIQTASINIPIHHITKLPTLMSNPIYFFTQPFIHPSKSMHSYTQRFMLPSPILLPTHPTIFPFIISYLSIHISIY